MTNGIYEHIFKIKVAKISTFEGSECAGSEREPACGAQPAPIEEATSVGTIVMREGLYQQVRTMTSNARQ